MSFASAGGFAMPGAPDPKPEYFFAQAAGINVDALTPEEAKEVDDLVARTSLGMPFGSAEADRLCHLRAKARRVAPADLGFVDDCEGGHGRASIKKSHRAEGRNFVD